VHLTPELLHQVVSDLQHDRQSEAAAHRLLARTPARTRIAHSLRRAADRLDGSAVGARADSVEAESARAHSPEAPLRVLSQVKAPAETLRRAS
jgi:hypothetical protein